jgi:hypothetical protein
MELDPSEWNQVELIAKGELEPVTLKRIVRSWARATS